MTLHGGNSLGRGLGGCERGDGGDAGQHSRAANGLLIENRVLPARRVDDQLDALALDEVHGIRTALVHLKHALHDQPRTLERVGRAFRGHDLEAQMHVTPRQRDGRLLVVILHGKEDGAARGQDLAGRELRLRKSLAKVACHAHHFAGRFHLRPEDGIDARELRPWKHRRFHVVVRAGPKIFS